jgi:hypothetical protein
VHLLYLHTCYMPRPSHSSQFDNPIFRWAIPVVYSVTSNE